MYRILRAVLIPLDIVQAALYFVWSECNHRKCVRLGSSQIWTKGGLTPKRDNFREYLLGKYFMSSHHIIHWRKVRKNKQTNKNNHRRRHFYLWFKPGPPCSNWHESDFIKEVPWNVSVLLASQKWGYCINNQPQLAIQLAIGSLPAIVVEHQERMNYLNEHKKFHQRVKKVFKWNFKLLQR